MTPGKTSKNGFILAGLTNILGVLIFSKAFTNDLLTQAYPEVFSNFGLLMIMIWGIAYLAASKIEVNIKWITLVFTIEKLVYVISWIQWISRNELSVIYSEDLITGVFYSIYGPIDFTFMLFFGWVFYTNHSIKSTS